MKRMLFVSFDQPEKVMGRLSVYVGREKVCTLSNHEKFDGVELEGGRQIIRAEFFPSLWLLPFVRRRVRNAEHALGAGIAWKHVLPKETGDCTLSFTFRAPRGGGPGEVIFDFQEKTLSSKEERGEQGHGMPFRWTDTGKDLVRRLHPPAFPGDTTYSVALELPYTLLGFVSCDAMPGQRDLEFSWEYLCELPSGDPVLIREYYNVSTDTSYPSGIERKHLCGIEAETLIKAKAAQIQKHMMPTERRTVHLPISLLPEMKDDDFFGELYRFSHPKGQVAPEPEDHRWNVRVLKQDIHPGDFCGPFDYELDDRMTVQEFLRFLVDDRLSGYLHYKWTIVGGDPSQTLGLIAHDDPEEKPAMNTPGEVCEYLTQQLNQDDLIQCCAEPDLTLKDLNITKVDCVNV